MPKDIAVKEQAGACGEADDDLARAAAGGDADAFVALIERHYDRVFRLAWRWCGSRTEAEDIAQDVWIKIGRAIRGWRGEAAFATWAYRIVYTTTTDRLRARQRLRLVEPSKMAMLAEVRGEPADEDRADAGVMKDELWAEVRRLPEQQRDAVLLVYGEDMSHAEAAQVMGCSEKTVSWHLHEARKRLKARFEADR